MEQFVRKSFTRLKHSVWLVGLMLVLLPEVGWGQIIISQYIETNSGSTPKGIELWNASGVDITFSASNKLEVFQGTNGAAIPTTPLVTVTSGTLAAGAVMVIGTSNIGTYISANAPGVRFVSYNFTFNGDDALQISLAGTITDVLGTPGSDPGSAWTGGGVSTADNNIQLRIGITTASSGFTDPSLRFETVANGSTLTGFGVAPGPSISIPILSLPTATAITTTSATLGATIDTDGGAPITGSGVAYGTSANPTTPTVSSLVTSGPFAENVTGLVSNTEYFYRGYATNSAGTGYSIDGNFTTVSNALMAKAATSVNASGFVANWDAPGGTAAITKYYIDIATDNAFSNIIGNNLDASTTLNYPVSGLTANTQYFYRVRAENAGGVSANSNVISLITTSSAALPAVNNLTYALITASTVTLEAEVISDGGAIITDRGFVYGTIAGNTSNPTSVSGTTGVFNLPVSGLTANTTYYFRAFATNSVGTRYSPTEEIFTTATAAPVATAATNITSSSFEANWNVVTGAVSYKLDVATDNAFSTMLTGYNDLTVSGASQVVTGLTSGTPYYYRVRAVNTGGVSANSNIETITTSGPCIPNRLYFQGFEPNNNWPIGSASQFSISNAGGSGDTPANQRILNGSSSWQTNNQTNQLELAAVNVSNFTGKKIKIRLSSTSTTTGNGAETDDYVKAYVALDGGSFPATADVTVTGSNNTRYGYTGTAIAATSAGTPITVASSSNSVLANQYTSIEITIPDNATSVALKLEALNNATGEVWNVDDIEVLGCEIVNCSEPDIAASNANVTPAATTTQLTWTNGSGTNRLVVVSPNAISAGELPLDANIYVANPAYGTTGTAIGNGFIVFNGNTDNVLISDLLSGTTYHYAIIEYSCSPENYNITSYLSGFFTTTACAEPVTEASNIIFSNVQQTQMDLSWTNGSGEKRVVVAVENGSISAAETPVDAIDYLANAAFGTSANAIGNGFVVYNGTGNAVTVSNLNHSKAYTFAVFEFNCVPENYKTDVFVSATQSTVSCPEPLTQATALLTPIVKDDRINLSWTNGSGTGRIILAKAGGPLTAADYPINNVTYNLGDVVGGSFVAYTGTNSTVSVAGLSANTTYYFGVFEYSCDPQQYLTTSFASANATTLPPALVQYSFNGSAGNEPTFAPDAQPANATSSDMTRSGLSPSPSEEAFSSSSFSTGAMNSSFYYAFTISPDANYEVTLTKLELDERRSGTGIRNWSVRSSIDGFVTDIAAFNVPDDTNERIDNEILLNTSFQNLTSAVEFRIYGYNAEASGGTWRIDNVQVFGTVTQLPPPAVTTLQFSKATETVFENGATVSVDVVIAGESATSATSVDVVLISGNAADVFNYTTQTITFPAGSNANQNVTFTLTDNFVFQGSRLLTFQLQNVTGGNLAETGSQNTFELTIVDNELPEIFINEFHYTNSGSDVDEFVEVVIPQDFTELNNVTLTLYNGYDGESYASYKLNTFVTNDLSYGNYKVYTILIPGIQNGDPDGFSLDYAGQLMEFISYGGTFTASNGPAVGFTSVDVGFTETGSDPVGTSIYLTQGGSPWVWAKQTGSNTMGLPNTNQPLPVELLTFTAKANENATVLTWETASEQNSSHFDIQRSRNAQTFETIGFVEAAGHSQTLKRYAFEDKNPVSGITYYRLKQVDTDGSIAYSKIEQVNRNKAGFEVQLYPNPTTGATTLILPENNLAKIQIVNVLGQVVYSQEVNKTNRLQLNLRQLPAGTYQVMVETPESRVVKKLVKTTY